MTEKSRTFHLIADVAMTVPVPGADPMAVSAVGGRVLQRGDEITIDDAFIAATTDRTGASWASDLSEEAQILRWGVARFREGTLESNVELVTELARERAAEAESLRQANVIESRRYRRGPRE